MKKRSTLVVISILLCLGIADSLAEISVGNQDNPSGLLMATADGEDPTPVPWGRVRDYLSLEHLLNADAPGSEYGPADFAVDPLNGQPVVVWSWWDGTDFEVQLSRWTGTGWSAAETLTDNGVDDLDPAIAFTPAGDCLVSWWRSGSEDQIWFLEKPAGSGWEGAERVTQLPHTGWLPGIAEVGGDAFTAYQAVDGALTDVVVSARGTGWEPVVIASTQYQGPGGDGSIFVRIHSRQGRTWADWVDGPGVVAYSIYDPQTQTWSSPSQESYSWDTAAGESEYWERESARVRIALTVLR